MRPDFDLVWGSDNAPFTPIEASDYTAGWVFRTGAPPRRVNFDYFQNLSDQRTQWLGEQMLQAVGHDWQDDVPYNLEAYTRSPVNDKLYKSLDAVNLGNEPSATPLKWREVPDLSASLAQKSVGGVSSGLKITTTGLSAVVTVTATAISAITDAFEAVILAPVSVSPSLAASGANGLDTGTSTASTWYYVWVIWNGTTTAGLLSLSSTAPTMPAGYTHKALVGAILTDATGNKFPLSFKQNGNLASYKVATGSNLTGYPVCASGVAGSPTVPTYVSVSLANFIPPNARAVIFMLAHIQADQNLNAIVSSTNQTGALHSITNPPEWAFTNSNTGGTSSYPIRIQLETPQQLYWANNSGNSKLRIIGWEF